MEDLYILSFAQQISTFLFASIAGFIGALLGIGGGTIIVPVLTVYYHVSIKEAIAVSIVSVIATSTAGGSRYVEQKITNVKLALFLESATTTGALSGAFLVIFTPQSFLFLILASIISYLFLSQIKGIGWETDKIIHDKFIRVKEDTVSKKLGLSSKYYDVAEGKEVIYRVHRSTHGFVASYFAGIISGLLGIGGGILKVSFMNQIMEIPLKVAIATSKFMIGVTASTSALLYFLSGLVNLSLAAPIALGVALGATTGTMFMNRIKVKKLKLMFSFLLLYFAYLMFAKGVYLSTGVKFPGV